MTKEVRLGETVPLDRMADVFKCRALLIALRAIELDIEVPQAVADVLEATDDSIRISQYGHVKTYDDMDKWANEQIENL